MSYSTSEAELAAVLAVVRQRSDATLPKIAAGLDPKVPRRKLQRRLALLVEQGRVIRSGASTRTRYRVCAVAAGGSAMGGAVSGGMGGVAAAEAGADDGLAAVRQWLRRPAGERPPLAYSRLRLDAYAPNETYYVPAEWRARWAAEQRAPTAPFLATTGAGTGGGVALAAHVRPVLVALMLATRRLEERLGLVRRWKWRSPPAGTFESLLDRPDDPRLVSGMYMRLWNHRMALEVLARQAGPLDEATVVAVQRALARSALPAGVAPSVATDGGVRATASGVPAGVDGGVASVSGSGPREVKRRPRPAPPVFREAPLALVGTSYRPLTDAIVARGCLRQILGTAAAVRDPVEAAHFLFAHLVWLLPFGIENLSMAALVANHPLMRAGLRPVAWFGGDVEEAWVRLVGKWEGRGS